MTPAVTFRSPDPDHLAQVGVRLWERFGEKGEPDEPPEQWVERFLLWCEAHETTHKALVGVIDGDHVVAYGFTAFIERVPRAGIPQRLSADIQSVWVRPDLRNAGIGGRLIEALVASAREAGAEFITVHSSDGAVRAYERAGFEHDRLMMFQGL